MPEPLLEPSLLAAGVWLVLAGIVAVVLFITSYFVKTTDKSEWKRIFYTVDLCLCLCLCVFFIIYMCVCVYFNLSKYSGRHQPIKASFVSS